jgi:amino acid permease
VVHAAYDAFSTGLNWALTISCFLLLASALVAYFTGTAESVEEINFFGQALLEEA